MYAQAVVERFTKGLVLLWTAAALVAQAWLLRSWPALPFLTAGAAALACGGRLLDRRTVAGVLVFSYLTPALISRLHGVAFAPYTVLWMAALFGVMLPDLAGRSWTMPSRWRGPLVFSVCAVMVSAGVVIWRESDGAAALLFDSERMFWRGGDPPPFVAMWTLHVALILVLGVLWFEWLCSTQCDVEHVVVTPLIVSATLMASVAAVQLFVDMRFLNATAFYGRGRTTGTMDDANVLGTLGVLWIGSAALWGARAGGRRMWIGFVVMVLSGVAVWGSGAKSALVAAIAVTAAIPLTLGDARSRLRPKLWIPTVVTAAALLLGIVWLGPTSARLGNPGARLWRDVAAFGSPAGLLTELWVRNGFGAAASAMIRQFPVSGIGIGRFYAFVTAYPRSDRLGLLPPDNAQNWLRHQIAELGWLGALGWIVWVATFTAFLLAPHPRAARGAALARVTVAAFGVMSLFGMPGQDVMVAITFWTLAFWCVRLNGEPLASAAIGRGPWIAGAIGLVIFAGSAVTSAVGELRPVSRARASGAPFSYGFAPPDQEGATSGYRITRAAAMALLDPTQRWLAISLHLAEGRPAVDVRVKVEHRVVLKARLASASPMTAFVRLEPVGARLLLESSATVVGESPWHVAGAGDIGLRVKWSFLDQVPPGVQGYRNLDQPKP